jgi:Subtilase family
MRLSISSCVPLFLLAAGCAHQGLRLLSADPFATPYAIVSCSNADVLPADRSKWNAVTRPDSGVGLVRGADTPGQGFCVYRWAGAGLPSREDFQRIKATPDSPILGISGDGSSVAGSTDKPLVPTSQIAFERQARGMDIPSWFKFYDQNLTSKVPVVVAVIDGSPTSKRLSAPDTSGHGFSVSRVIGGLLCRDVDSDDCAKRVVPYLALPILAESPGDFREDFVNGGRTGSFFQLYDAIEAAMQNWNPQSHHLVINLSMGWDPVKTDPGDENVERIKALLERASRMGALIVGASGNFSGSDGPIGPGAFEAIPAPGGPACEKPRAGSYRVGAPYAPLVHSVGVVDLLDQRTPLDRRWGEPRLVAYGINISPPALPGQASVPPLSGTSMSTAVVSAIAAAVWTTRPELTAAQVMELVYQGGIELDGGERSKRARTEYCLCEPYGPCDGLRVHRASMCGALAKALPGEGLVCDLGASQDVRKNSGGSSPSSPVASDRPPSCHVTNCGAPVGVSPSQLSLATAPHGGGFAGCPGCKISFANGLISVFGQPQIDDWYRQHMVSFSANIKTSAPDPDQSLPLNNPANFWDNPLEQTQNPNAIGALSAQQYSIHFSVEIKGVGIYSPPDVVLDKM